MVTIFNSDYGYAVVELFFSNRGTLCREVVVAACRDLDTAIFVTVCMRRENPYGHFNAQRVV